MKDYSKEENKLYVENLIRERNEARKRKEYAKVNRIRKDLLKSGIILEDTGEGTRWKIEGK